MIGLGGITSLFKAAGGSVDELHTSEEEKLSLKNAFAELQGNVMSDVLEYQKSLNEAQANIIMAEVCDRPKKRNVKLGLKPYLDEKQLAVSILAHGHCRAAQESLLQREVMELLALVAGQSATRAEPQIAVAIFESAAYRIVRQAVGGGEIDEPRGGCFPSLKAIGAWTQWRDGRATSRSAMA